MTYHPHEDDREGCEADLAWDNLPDILTAREVAGLLRLPKSAIYAAIRLGVIPAINAGRRRIRVSKEALRKSFLGRMETDHMTAAFGHVPEAK